MKKILFLGGDPGTCEMIKVAKKEGWTTIVTDWYDVKHSKAKRVADTYWEISYSDLDTLENMCKEEHIDAVMAASSEYATEMMIELCDRLNIPCWLDREAFHYEKDKMDFKLICKKNGVRVPKMFEANDITDYPVVVKPVDQCGGHGITYCDNFQQVISACEKVREISKNPKIIIEQRISGIVYAAYYAILNGEPFLLFIHSEYKSEMFQPNPAQTACTSQYILDLYKKKMDGKVKNALKECGCKSNCAWVEMVMDADENFWIIEMACRLGSDLAAVEYSKYGSVDLIKWGVECAMGVEHSIENIENDSQFIAYSYMLAAKKSGIVNDVVGIEYLESNGYDVLINICIGDYIEYGKKEIGYIGFVGKSNEEIALKIDEINKNLKILDKNGENLILEYMNSERFLKEHR